MQGARGGYTIIEVLIVLAVTSALFVAAITVFSGKQGKTQFLQSMQDLNSKIQSVVSGINVSVFPGAGQYSCTTQSNRPNLGVPVGPGDTTGANGECLFLGKGIQADTDTTQGHLYIYTVLGSRINPFTGNLATTYLNSNPEPAMGQGACGLPCDLTEDYSLQFGATIKSSKISTSTSPPSGPTETDLVGFYTSLQTTSNSGSQTLLSYGYSGFKTKPKLDAQVRQTLENALPPYSPPTPIEGWYLCVQSGTSNEMSELVVSSSPAGVTTKVNYGVCS